MHKLFAAIVTSMGLWALPVQAQTDNQIIALVEALRLAAPDTGIENDGLYSEWQIKPENIVGWSQFCKQPTTPEAFEANPDLAWSIMTCVVGDLLQEEYAASGSNIEVAVLRSASWWMTGDSTLYANDATIAEYAGTVLYYYAAQQP
ncbi:MAG: hypothetical protein ACOYME_13510 [Prochlorotrichaceae cyanobacterium]|jgi:hypothetical protein